MTNIVTIWFVFLGLVAATANGSVVRWGFESGENGWTPRATTVAVVHAPDIGASDRSKGSLHVFGTLEGGWNYARSPDAPLEAGRLYRLSAWMRVDRLGDTTPTPFLKSEFVAREPGRDLGRASTSRYNRRRMGEWQRLVAEFRAPDGVSAAWVAIETGTRDPVEIDAYLDEVVLEPIEALTALERYRLDPIPASLAKRRGVHPRLYVDDVRVEQLRAAIRTTHAHLWEEMKEVADRARREGPPTYREDDGRSGEEQLWERGVGNMMPYLALAYLLTKDRSYLESAQEWALASASYPTWGAGRIDGMDLATGHQLFGLALVYDWAYDDLDPDARATILRTLIRRGSAMFEAAAMNRAWWRNSYLQNHLWVNVAGLAAAGLAIFDEHEDAIRWPGMALDKWRRTLDSLGPDGASHEGVGYWQYGVEYLLKFMYLSRDLLDTDLYDHPWFRNTAAYALYMTIPRNAWTRRSSIVDLADCPRGNWYGPDHLLRAIAAEYRDGYAQWLAEQVDEADIDSPSARWLNLIWYDPSVEATPPDDLPTLRLFSDMGIVSARSDWTGDESLVVFKSGPYIGRTAMERYDYDPGGGHVHPDANHFVIFGEGEWLIRDDGYRAKATGQHNTLLVDGRGQLGEGRMWFKGGAALAVRAMPKILRADSTDAFDHIVGDATEAYPPDLGLTRYVRHLLFMKPDGLLVIDEIETDDERALELRFHPERPARRGEDGAYIAVGAKSRLRIEPLTTEGVVVTAEELPGAGREGREGEPMFTIRLQTRRTAWRNAVAFSWAGGDTEPSRVHLSVEGNLWKFTIAGRTVTLDLATGSAFSDEGPSESPSR